MKKYWKSLEELEQNQNTVKKDPQPEFSIEGLSEQEVKNRSKSNRRDFLKMMGFTVGAAAIASSCEQPVRKAIPFLNKPEEVTPGQANWYASTYFDGKDYASILVKVRDGRPIKIEGNELSKISQGGTHARIQASVLSLYDDARLKAPMANGEEAVWHEVDQAVSDQLSVISQKGKKIVFLTSTLISPSSKRVLKDFVAKFPTAEVVYYDAVSSSAMLTANDKSFGKAELPSYHLDKAKVLVSFNADFLGNWIDPVQMAADYAKGRRVANQEDSMSRHYQFESGMSLSGSNADYRYPIKPSDEFNAIAALYNKCAKQFGMPMVNAGASVVDVDPIFNDLLKAQGASVVMCGSNHTASQILVNAINYMLSNYGEVIDFEKASMLRAGIDSDMIDLVKQMNDGNVGALLIHNVNPAYDYYNADAFKSGLKKVELSVSFADRGTETSNLCNYVCPTSHYLESWDDAMPVIGSLSLQQPTINKIFDTRQWQESILTWSGNDTDYYSYIKKYWEEIHSTTNTGTASFKAFWTKSLHDGIYEAEVGSPQTIEFKADVTSLKNPVNPDGFELSLYESVGLGNGNQANNPWLQEMPDPITKSVWDNFVAMSAADAKELGIKFEDVVKVNNTFDLPVIVQPGQAKGTISIALGYGRTAGGVSAEGIGQNAYAFVNNNGNEFMYSGAGITLEKTGATYPIATTQTHHSMEGRNLVRETTLKKYKKDAASGNETHVENMKKQTTLYATPEFEGFRWAMSIDLNACIGCSNCVIACQAENNVAVIGKEEVKRRRIMHWIRIDRYFSDDAENPSVYHQPVMCMHCDNAPCENVCPVAATPHSGEGLNMMAYNRCIGTRYCMNNCPYRVRRFNWYQYANNEEFPNNPDSDLARMVLNPDVTVRSRGVVEKCSLCVQRIQEKKLEAKKDNRMIKDGEIQSACSQSCPTKAITFGNLEDPKSVVSKEFKSSRNYTLLEELHTLSTIGYLTKIRNNDQESES